MEITRSNYFNPCNVRPSNARFVIFRMFTVADAAGAATLQFRRSGVVPFFLQAGIMGECRAVGRRVNHKIAEKICLFQPLIKIVISESRFLNCYA